MASFVVPNQDSSGAGEPVFVNTQSRGAETSKATTTLFSGLSDTIKMGVEAVDSAFKSAIRTEATASIDLERDKLINARLPDAPTPSSTDVPPEVKKQLERLAQAKEAARAGLMNDSYRDILYDSVSRDLRYKYAGYRDYIDDTISKLTGFNPANRLLDDLRAEAAKGATSEEKAYDAYVKQAISHGIDIPNLVRQNNGRPLPLDHIQSLVANNISAKASREQAQAELTYRKGSREETVQIGIVQAKEMLDQNDSRSRSTALKGLGMTPAFLQQLALDYQANPSLLTPEAESKLRNAVGSYLQAAEVEDRKFLSTPTQSGKSLQTSYGFDNQHIESLVTQKKAEREAFFKPLLDKEFGVFQSQLRTLEASKLSLDAKLLSEDNTAVFASVRRQLGDTVANTVLAQDTTSLSGVMKDIDKTVAQTSAAKILTQQARSLAQVDAQNRQNLSVGKASVSQGAVTEWTANKLVEVAVNPKLDVLSRNNAIEGLFHRDNIGFIANVAVKDAKGNVDATASSAKRIELYSKLTTAEVREAVKVISQSNPQVLESYQNFAINTGITLGKQTLDDIKVNISGRDAFAQINFNEKTLTFSASPRELTPEGQKKLELVSPSGPGQMRDIDLARASRLANDMNTIVRQIKPALELAGSKDPANELRMRFNQFGVNIDTLRYSSNKDKFQGRLNVGINDPEIQGTLQELTIPENPSSIHSVGDTNRGISGSGAAVWPDNDAYKGIRDQILETMKLEQTPDTRLEIDGLFRQLNSLFTKGEAPKVGTTVPQGPSSIEDNVQEALNAARQKQK